MIEPVGIGLLAGLALFQAVLMTPVAIDDGEIVRLKDKAAISRETLVTALSRSRVVLIGEEHPDPGHHRIQLRVIEGVHRQVGASRPIAVAMEMFPGHLQPKLDRWVAGRLSEPAFLDAVKWYSTWGYDDALYMPILRYARKHRLPVLAVNVDRGVVRQVRKQGRHSLNREKRSLLPARIAPATTEYRIRLREVFDSHPMMGKAGPFDWFVDAQQTWDGVMAKGMSDWLRRHPSGLVLGIAGSGHLIHGHGISHQLRHQGVEDVVTVLPWTGSERWVPRDAADYAWGSPPAPETPPPVRLGILLDDGHGGVKISGVMPGGLGARSGLKKGDRIVALNGQKTPISHTLVRLIRKLKWGDRVTVTVRRGGRVLEKKIDLPGTPPES